MFMVSSTFPMAPFQATNYVDVLMSTLFFVFRKREHFPKDPFQKGETSHFHHLRKDSHLFIIYEEGFAFEQEGGPDAATSIDHNFAW